MAQQPTDSFPGRLIVHVGDHKAGSTSIQATLAAGGVRLRSGRLSYPLAKGKFNHNNLNASVQQRGLQKRRTNPAPMKKLAAIARAANPDVTVISAEAFEGCVPTGLRRALEKWFPVDPDALTVIAYLRPHASRAMSGLAEKIKIGRAEVDPWDTLGSSLWLRYTLSYASRLDAWRKAFGTAYHLRPMIRGELLRDSLVEDLFATALGDGAAKVKTEKQANVSLGIEDLMRLHVVHQSLPDLSQPKHHVLGWALTEFLGRAEGPAGPSTALKIDRAFAERLHRIFRNDARKVDAAYFGGRPLLEADLDRSVDTAVPDKLPLVPEEWLSPGEIRMLRAAARAFAVNAAEPGWGRALKSDRLAAMMGG